MKKKRLPPHFTWLHAGRTRKPRASLLQQSATAQCRGECSSRTIKPGLETQMDGTPPDGRVHIKAAAAREAGGLHADALLGGLRPPQTRPPCCVRGKLRGANPGGRAGSGGGEGHRLRHLRRVKRPALCAPAREQSGDGPWLDTTGRRTVVAAGAEQMFIASGAQLCVIGCVSSGPVMPGKVPGEVSDGDRAAGISLTKPYSWDSRLFRISSPHQSASHRQGATFLTKPKCADLA